MRRDLIGGIARQVLAGPQVIYYFDKSVPNVPARVSTSLPPRLSLRVLANYHFLAYLSLLLLIASFASGFKLSSVMCFAFFSWIVFMAIRWLLGQAPLVPFVSVHDISDCRPNYSFGWWMSGLLKFCHFVQKSWLTNHVMMDLSYWLVNSFQEHFMLPKTIGRLLEVFIKLIKMFNCRQLVFVISKCNIVAKL